jgi:pyruvate/2-oxoglutarate dehydrogenase complex dihydrolipoamide acyltransferase (E2) component
MAFEAQDGGYVAKLLVKAGDGADIKIGEPILVTVEEKEYVLAFKDFVVSSDLTVKKSAPESTPPVTPAVNTNVSEVKAVLPTPSPTVPVVKAENLVPSIQPKTPVAQTITPMPATNVVIPSISAPISSISTSPLPPTVGPSWGNLARVVSPLSKILSAEQKIYIDKFGSTGQSPL